MVNEQLEQFKDEVRRQAAMDNAKRLVEKLNEHCFERCFPKIGPSISSSEQTCLTQCMEKYLSAWDTVSRHYFAHIQSQEQSHT